MDEALRDLGRDDRYATNAQRVTSYAVLRPLVADAILRQPVDRWVARLREASVPAGAVRSLDDVFSDPQVAAREMAVTLPHATIGSITMLGVPVKLSATPGRVRTPPPRLGEHTASVLREDAGVDAAALDRLVAARVVRMVR